MSAIDWSGVQHRLGRYYPGMVDGVASAMTWIGLVGYAAPSASAGDDAVTLRGRKLAEMWESAGLTTPDRIAGLLSNIAHETGDFTRLRESLYYTTARQIRITWPTRFTTDSAAQPYVRNPEALANRVYARPEEGNTATGDGWRYRGGGDIQVTFRNGYRAAGARLGLPLEAHPELIEAPATALLTALGYWKANGLNAYFDRGEPRAARSLINTGQPDAPYPGGWDDVEPRHARLVALLTGKSA